MVPSHSNIALKEWSVAIEALAQGEQVVLLRKGGIHEDGRHFRIEHDGFFLYPTSFHQGADLLKPDKRGLMRGIDDDTDQGMVTLALFAEVAEVIRISEVAAVNALAPFHIFSNEYAVKRAHWKPRDPLHVIIVRCHRLQMPQALPVMGSYAGCKSWVELVEPYPLGIATPVLPDRRFDVQRAAIKTALAGAGTTA